MRVRVGVAEQQQKAVVVGILTENVYKGGGNSSEDDGLTNNNNTGKLLIIGIPGFLISIGSKFFGASFVNSKLYSSFHFFMILFLPKSSKNKN